MERLTVAIDGPAGAGKSSAARLVAKRLGYLYIDTGAMYRAFTWAMLQEKIDIGDAEAVRALTERIDIRLEPLEDKCRVFVGEREVTDAIRTQDISSRVSSVSALAVVREKLVQLQRNMAEGGGVILDGRDIGTVVLPHADVKIFLTADAEVRAKRRYDELQQKGDKTPYAQILAETKQRDKQDSERAAAPLRQAADAVVLDTSGYTLEQSVEAILALVRRKLG